MKTDWERTTPVIVPSRDELAACLRRADGSTALVGFDVLSGGLANTNIRLRTDGETDYVLRLHQRDPASADREALLFPMAGMVVPVPVMVAHGKPGDILAHRWSVLRYMPGEPMDALAAPGRHAELASAMHHAGTLLAKLQALGPMLWPFPPTVPSLELTPAVFTDWLDAALGPRAAGPHLPRPLTGRVRRFADAWTHALASVASERALVHCDYNGANLLVAGGRVTAVLDWEFAMSGTSLWDIGNMLRHFAHRPEVHSPFIEGFRADGGRLPERWRELAALLDIMNLADMIGRSEPGSKRQASMIASIDAHLEACGA